MVDIKGLLEAYYDCRRRKRRTASAIMYEIDYESRLVDLKNRINNRTYMPGKSICFVVSRPRYREVFASSFEDRIVHHWISLRLEPLFEKTFSTRTFNCRKGKGQLYGINILKHDILTCSQNYTLDCYIMKLDLQGFFMSIRKTLLSDLIDEYILKNYIDDDIDDLRFLCKTVILHKPEENCERHSPLSYWNHLPPSKSLFTNGEGLGVAIGNLFSQLFANFLLNHLDWYILRELGFTYTGRYVDDFYIISENKDKLLSFVPKIRKFLSGYGLRLHPTKFYIQHYTKGVSFIGSVVLPGRVYTCNHTIKSFTIAIKRLNSARNIRELNNAISSVNSYLGCLRHANEYNTRRKLLNTIKPSLYKWIYIKGHYDSIALKNRYKKRNLIIRSINDTYRERTCSKTIHPQNRCKFNRKPI